MERDLAKYNPSIKLSTVKLLEVVSHYSIGLAFIRHNQSWRFLLKYCSKDHTMYVVRAASKLIYELLYKYSVKLKDDATVLAILGEMMAPIMENVFEMRTDSIEITVDDSEMQHTLAPTLDLVSYILQQTLESEEKTNLVDLFDKHFQLEFNLWKLIQMTQNEECVNKILSCLSSFNFAKVLYYEWHDNKQIGPDKLSRYGVTLFNLFKFCNTRSLCTNFLKQAELNHVLWKKLGNRAPPIIHVETEKVSLENQLITLQLMPVLFMLRKQHDEFLREDVFDTYLMKLFEINCEQTLRLCYGFRDIILTEDMNTTTFYQDCRTIQDLSIKSINGILSMENVLERDQATLVFQGLIYALKEFILQSDSMAVNADTYDCKGNVKPKPVDMIIETPHVLYAILFGLQRLIQRYRITWKESIETICVVNSVAVILDNPNLPSLVCINFLYNFLHLFKFEVHLNR